MVKGYEYREGAKDPNANATAKPNPLPMTPVQAPRPASMAAVGADTREMAKLFSKGSTLMESYFTKKKDVWRLEGQMAYAEGKAEQDIRAEGNKYTAEGYSSLKIQTMANEWYSSKLNSSEDIGKSTDQYKQELMQGFNALNNRTADPFEKEHLAALTGEMFPKLVTQHIQANNTFHAEQSKKAVKDALKSKADLEKRTLRDYERNLVLGADSDNTVQLKELLSMPLANLTPEQQQESIYNSIDASLATGNASLLNAYADLRETLYSDTKTTSYSKKLQELEGTGKNPFSSASGKYQFVNKTWVAEVKKVRPDLRDKTNAEIIALKGTDPVLLEAVFESFTKGNRESLSDALGRPPTNGELYLAHQQGVQGTKNLLRNPDSLAIEVVTPAHILNNGGTETMLAKDFVKKWSSRFDKDQPVKEERLLTKLVRLGQTPENAASIVTAYKKLQNKENVEYDRQKILDEQQLMYDSENTGNLKQALINAEKVKEDRGYSDKWLASQVTSIKSAVKRGTDKRAEEDAILYSVSNNTLGLKTPQQQQIGINLKKQLLALEAQKTGIPEENQAGYIREGLMDFYVKNDVMDDALIASMSSGLSGDISGTDVNTVSEEALNAYAEYGLYDRASGNVGAMLEHLPKDVQTLVLLAQSYDDKTDSGYALARAHSVIQSDKTAVTTEQLGGVSLPQKVLRPQIENMIRDKLIPGFWRAYGLNAPFTAKTEGSYPRHFREEDVQSAVNTPAYQNFVQTKFKTLYREYATSMSPDLANKLAQQKTFTDLVNNSEYVMGTMVYTPSTGESMAKRMNIGQIQNGADAATRLYVQTFGTEVWGKDIFEGATPFLEDIPYMNTQYSADTGTLLMRPWAESRDIGILKTVYRAVTPGKVREVLMETPLVASVDRIGALYRASLTGNDEVLQDAINNERILLQKEMKLFPKE